MQPGLLCFSCTLLLQDQRDTEFVEELMNVLGDEVKEVESFVIVYKYKDRFTSPFARTLRVITKMFGNFWSNVVILVNFWSFNPLHVQVGKMQHPPNNTNTQRKPLIRLSLRRKDPYFVLPRTDWTGE